MDPLTLWLLATGGVSLTLLLTRPAQAATSPEPKLSPPPSPSYGDAQRVNLIVPSGWRRVSSGEIAALPELLSQANALRSSSGFKTLPYGTMFPFTASDGRLYATWVEQHYHEPGGSVLPWGFHHGVTILART